MMPTKRAAQMASEQPKPGEQRGWQENSRFFLVLAAIAVIYAFLSNLRTIADPDVFWQLATGRWVAQHHAVFSTDVFSYTAHGQPWIYPVGSGLILYGAYLIGSYALISWLGAATCASAVALLLRRGSAASATIAIVSVPLLAGRTAPRAEMFTVVLFAAYLSILWENFQTGRARLWLLPLLMIVWVNLHLGFVAGLALIFAFIGVELLEMLFPDLRRWQAIQRLRRASPWFAATGLATLLNPWGWGIYSALVRQGRAQALHSGWINEWGSMPMNWTAAATALSLRGTRGTFYLIVVIAIAAALIALRQRQLGTSALLIGATCLGVQQLRMDALAASVAVVVGGSSLNTAIQLIRSHITSERLRFALGTLTIAAMGMLVCRRSVDLVKNYRNHSTSRFGTGLTWWAPERAAEFIEREHLPPELFNTYNVGGYVVWRLGPEYLDYVDGRAIPFGPGIFRHQDELMQSSLDSEVWRRETDRFKINTILLPLLRFENLGGALKMFCQSAEWRPVYLDEIAAVFVRRRPDTEDLIKRLQIDCSTAPLPAGPLATARDDAFNQWANAASVLAVLGRYSEALDAAEKASRIYPDSFFPHGLRGSVFETMGLRRDAEREYLTAASLEPGGSVTWFSLAMLYQQEGRIAESIQAQRKGIDLSSSPQPRELITLARLYLQAQQPQAALKAFDKAVRCAPPDLIADRGPLSFNYEVALGRAEAWRTLGDNRRAASYEEEAVRDLLP